MQCTLWDFLLISITNLFINILKMNKEEPFDSSLNLTSKTEASSTTIVRDEETLLLYLLNTYQFEGESKVVGYGCDAKGSYVILNETIFYPQGGGQPSDIGTIETIDGLVLNVYFVSFLNGKVYHYIKENTNALECGKTCFMKIDSERRLKNAKSHTSGHLLASIVEKIAPELVAFKGYHFPEGPYVEFKGKLTSLSNTDLIQKVTEISREKIALNVQVMAKEVDHEVLQNLKATEFQLQKGKKARVVEIDGFEAVPCGGTHLKELSELKEVSIRKIQAPKDGTRISYAFS
jgi:Ser-tRNA(Ala) deacylase AlaX